VEANSVWRLVPALLGAIAVLAATLAFPSASTAAESCRTKGTTVARNGVARIYSVNRYTPDRYACVLRSGRTVHLDSPDSTVSGEANMVRLAGYYVLLENRRTGDPSLGNREDTQSASDQSTIDVRNLRTGRLRRIRASGGTATDFVLKDNGAFAEIRSSGGTGSLTEPSVRQVRRFDRRGFRAVAQGIDINIFSLGLRGSVVRWRQGGQVRRATLR
jgi:hypothetical protein